VSYRASIGFLRPQHLPDPAKNGDIGAVTTSKSCALNSTSFRQPSRIKNIYQIALAFRTPFRALSVALRYYTSPLCLFGSATVQSPWVPACYRHVCTTSAAHHPQLVLVSAMVSGALDALAFSSCLISSSCALTSASSFSTSCATSQCQSAQHLRAQHAKRTQLRVGCFTNPNRNPNPNPNRNVGLTLTLTHLRV